MFLRGVFMIYMIKTNYYLSEILFIGDDFGDGGGDSLVRIFGLDYIEITVYRNTRGKLKFLL